MDTIKITIEYKGLGLDINQLKSKLKYPFSQDPLYSHLAVAYVKTFDSAKKIFTDWSNWVAEIDDASVSINYLLISNEFELTIIKEC